MLDQHGNLISELKKVKKELQQLKDNQKNCSCDCCSFEDVTLRFNAVNPQGSNLALRPVPEDWGPGTKAKFINIDNKADYYDTTIEHEPIVGTHNGEPALIFQSVNWIVAAGVPAITYKKKVVVTSI